PRRDYGRNMWCCDNYPLVLLPRRVGWIPSLYTQYARYGTFQRLGRAYVSDTCRVLSRDCGRLHRSTLAGVRTHWCPCLVTLGTGRVQPQSRLWCAAVLCPLCRRPCGGSHDVRGARAPCTRLAVGSDWPSRRSWSDGRLSVASACAYGDLSIGQSPRRTSNTKGRACQRTM